jgi:hypothetical protein
MIPDPARLRDFATHYTAALCSQNPSSVAAFYSPDGSLAVNGGTPAVGREAITAEAQGFMTSFPDLQVLLDNLLITGDRVQYHWTLIGTNAGPGGTGHKVRISGYEAWTIGEDGLIAESQEHFDNKSYENQLKHGI